MKILNCQDTNKSPLLFDFRLHIEINEGTSTKARSGLLSKQQMGMIKSDLKWRSPWQLNRLKNSRIQGSTYRFSLPWRKLPANWRVPRIRISQKTERVFHEFFIVFIVAIDSPHGNAQGLQFSANLKKLLNSVRGRVGSIGGGTMTTANTYRFSLRETLCSAWVTVHWWIWNIIRNYVPVITSASRGVTIARVRFWLERWVGWTVGGFLDRGRAGNFNICTTIQRIFTLEHNFKRSSRSYSID